MTVTKNFVLLVVAGLFLTILGWFFGYHQIVFLLWNLLLVGLLALDFLITPGGKQLTVRRVEDENLYFKTFNTVGFIVENMSKHNLTVEGKDEKHRFFSVYGVLPIHTVPSRSEQLFTYTTIPAKRGSFSFERINLRYNGVIGLCVKHAAYHCPTEFKVYPNVRDLSKFRLMMQQTRLLPRGEKNIRQYGVGTEFESLRSYVEGDDYRKINWRATARGNKLMVNMYQVERNQPVYILIDIGRPMSYSVNGFKKLDFAINAALVLSDIVNQGGDKVGLMVFDSKVRTFIPPGQGAGHRNQLMEALYHVADNRSTADYESAFRTLCEKQKRRSLVFIFTDFELPDEAQELISYMAILKKRHMPVVVFMANEGLDALAEQEVYKEFDKVLRDTAREFLSERKLIFRNLTMMGIPNIESGAENFASAAVNRYLRLKSAR